MASLLHKKNSVIITRDCQGDFAAAQGLHKSTPLSANFVFAPFGTKRCKDKDMDPDRAPNANGLPFPKSPAIVFANWLETLHQSGLAKPVQAG